MQTKWKIGIRSTLFGNAIANASTSKRKPNDQSKIDSSCNDYNGCRGRARDKAGDANNNDNNRVRNRRNSCWFSVAALIQFSLWISSVFFFTPWKYSDLILKENLPFSLFGPEIYDGCQLVKPSKREKKKIYLQQKIECIECYGVVIIMRYSPRRSAIMYFLHILEVFPVLTHSFGFF